MRILDDFTMRGPHVQSGNSPASLFRSARGLVDMAQSVSNYASVSDMKDIVINFWFWTWDIALDKAVYHFIWNARFTPCLRYIHIVRHLLKNADVCDLFKHQSKRKFGDDDLGDTYLDHATVFDSSSDGLRLLVMGAQSHLNDPWIYFPFLPCSNAW